MNDCKLIIPHRQREIIPSFDSISVSVNQINKKSGEIEVRLKLIKEFLLHKRREWLNLN